MIKEQFNESMNLIREESEDSASSEREDNNRVNSNNGKWSHVQHAKYIVFIEKNRSNFKSKEKRRQSKFYKSMANFIKTRNALQCRSHHQKLQDKYTYTNKIISAFKKPSNMQIYRQSILEHDLQFTKTLPTAQELQPLTSSNQVGIQTQISGIHMIYLYNNQHQMQNIQYIQQSFPQPPSVPSNQYFMPSFLYQTLAPQGINFYQL